MSCGCRKPDRTPLWTPIPPFIAGTAADAGDGRPSHFPMPGENMDCFMKRAPENGKDDAREKIPNLIDTTSIVVDKNGNVDTTFKLTPNSDKEAATWRIWTDGQPGTVPTDLNFNSATGQLSGQVPEAARNKNYKVEAKAFDSDGNLIDSRQYNMYPKSPSKGEDIQFVWPMSPKGRVTSGFGPRTSPTAGASSKHQGIDISLPGDARGDIVAAADGVIVKAGPAKGFGNAVFIEHRDSSGKVVATTVYGHMNDMYVKPGQKVSAGQKIAKEGNAGVGTGAHLHFEMHKGKWGNPVDPIPYLNGQHEIEGEEPVDIRDSVMVAREQETGPCAGELPGQYGTTQPNASSDTPSSEVNGGQGSDQSATEPPEIPRSSDPSKAQVQSEIQRALDEDPSLTAEDKKHLMFVAGIESGYDADAKNPQSSARGVYQMLDKTADAFYAKIGYPNPTEAQRNDPYLATKAQIEFYKGEQKRYWNEFQDSGGTRLAGRQLDPAVAARYQNLTQGEFTYGLIHHDGVGNAVRGRDMQGVDYYRRRVRALA